MLKPRPVDHHRMFLTCYEDTFNYGWHHVDLFVHDEYGREVNWVHWTVEADGPEAADESVRGEEPLLRRTTPWERVQRSGGPLLDRRGSVGRHYGMTSAQVTTDIPEATVYVVDDDPELCDSVDWILESIGIRPVICHSADAFLDVYDGSTPACIVLDVRMPGMSGTRLQEKINEFAPHVVIIFVSAHGDIRMSVGALQKGAMDFLEKPYDPQRLLDAVQSGAEKAEYGSPNMFRAR